MAGYLPGRRRREAGILPGRRRREVGEKCRLGGRAGGMVREAMEAARVMLELWVRKEEEGDEGQGEVVREEGQGEEAWCTAVREAAGGGRWAR